MTDTPTKTHGPKREHGVAVDRRTVLQGMATAAAGIGATGLFAPAVHAQAKKFAGVTISGAAFQSVFWENLKAYIPEFEAQSGAKVDLQTQAFPVYNQRMDLELSTKGSAYDFCCVTFIYSSRWIGAGWLSNLDEFTKDPNKTAAGWDAADFVSGTQSPLINPKGETFGFAWEAGPMLMAMSRYDLIEKAGMKTPTTFAELQAVCAAVNGKEGVAGYVNDRLHHWHLMPFLMGMGGNLFRNPPGDLYPTIDTPEAAEAAEYYSRLLTEYGPPGVMSFSDDQAMRAQMAGRANIRTQSVLWVAPLVTNPDSTVAKTTRYSLMPSGPKGDFPGSNSHGLGIPAGSKNKDAAWAFVQWALSKELLQRMLADKGYASICRRSVIDSPEYRKRMTLNGQDVAALYLQVLEQGGKGGYMKYRTVPVFPQVGDKINKAVERIASKQQGSREAMKQAQEEIIAELKKSGIPI